MERRLSPNLSRFKLDVQKFIDEHPGEGVLMTKFDIRQFKLLNKILGKEVGNTGLITIAAALDQETKIKGYCRAHDDEFYVFLCCSTSEELDKIRTSVWNQFYKCMGPGFSYPMEVIEGRYFMSFDDCQNAAEALVRWEKEGKLIPPNDFIPILEQKGLITKLDFYVLEQLCRKMQSWKNEGRELIEIAVNFSRRHLENPDFIQNLCSIADQYGIPHYLLVVELTETAMWENEKNMIQMVEQLHENGFLMAMDDFGTGYSSLSLLKNLPVDIVKIDRSFFYDNQYKDRARILISNVMNMAKQLGMVTVAEGIEEQRHIDFLRQVGCDKVQGYYFTRPVPAESFWEGTRGAG